jgi:hypothetical protein
MRRIRDIVAVGLIVVVLLGVVGCSSGLVLVALAFAPTRFAAPPLTLQEADLVGTWEVRYGRSGTDSLVLSGDGTFRQVFRSDTVTGYVYETPWNRWWIERLPGDRVWLHLQGGRYYLPGVKFGELGGRFFPCPEDWPDCRGGQEPEPWSFYDPYGREFLKMVDVLVLNVRSDGSGNIVLHHMRDMGDRGWGFAWLGGEQEVFRRAEGP